MPADQRADLVGQRAATDLPAGLLLTPDSTTADPIPAPGTSLVGVAVKPTQMPATPLGAGDPVTLVATPGDGQELPTGTSPSMKATVVAHPRPGRRLHRGRRHRAHPAGRHPGLLGVDRAGRDRARPGDPMSVLALASVAGAPGVTTTAVALALAWPRPVVLVEADPVGASAVLPGLLRGAARHDRGILDAAVAARSGTLAGVLPELLIDLPGGNARLLAGLARPEQAATMTRYWPLLAPALAEASTALGVDVILDAGRLSQAGAAMPALGTADRVLLVTRTHLPALHVLRAWLPTVRSALVDPARLGLLLVGEGQPYRAGEVSRTLGVPVAGVLPDDPDPAAAYSRGAPHPRRSEFARALAVLVRELATEPATAATAAAGGL